VDVSGSYPVRSALEGDPWRRDVGIRKTIQALRSGPGDGREPLRLTETAREEVRRRTDGEEGLSFFVLTQPSPLGYNVGVGFERGEPEAERPSRAEFDVPIRVAEEDWDRLRGYTIDFQDGRFVTFTDVRVHVGETPNPESRKFSVNRPLVTEGSATYRRPVSDEVPPLVTFLFDVPGVRALFFFGSFCTVTREPDAEWGELQMEVGNRLQAYFAHGGRAMSPSEEDAGDRGEVERRVIELLDDVVRPAVQKDGGDIAFAGYDEGTVQVYMLGSCVGCPSSLATLRMGVERLLKETIPEVREVVALD